MLLAVNANGGKMSIFKSFQNLKHFFLSSSSESKNWRAINTLCKSRDGGKILDKLILFLILVIFPVVSVELSREGERSLYSKIFEKNWNFFEVYSITKINNNVVYFKCWEKFVIVSENLLPVFIKSIEIHIQVIQVVCIFILYYIPFDWKNMVSPKSSWFVFLFRFVSSRCMLLGIIYAWKATLSCFKWAKKKRRDMNWKSKMTKKILWKSR